MRGAVEVRVSWLQGGNLRLRSIALATTAIVALSTVVVPKTLYASPRSPFAKMRGEYVRLRNIDPAGDNPAYQELWISLAAQMRGALVKNAKDSEVAKAKIDAADIHLRIYRTNKQPSYLTTARSLLSSLTEESVEAELNPELKARALLLLGDVYLYQGLRDSAVSTYERARLAARGIDGERAQDRLRGLRNGTYERFIPSLDIEVPRAIGRAAGARRNIGGPMVVIDAGHGGEDAGAVSSIGGEEKEVTLDIARRVKVLLERRHGALVQLTRDSDDFVPLARRTAFANRKEADVFVSLHVNASAAHDAEGSEVYYLDNSNDEASRTLAERENGTAGADAVDDLSFMLSDLIQSGKMEDSIVLSRSLDGAMRKDVVASQKGLRSLGVKKAPFFVLVGAHMPCALVEMFFIDHPEEGRKFRQDSFRSALAVGIANGIGNFLKKR